MKRSVNVVLNVLLVVLSVLVVLALMEVYFRLFYDASHSVSSSITHLRWWQRHWMPINSLGFRDIEHDPKIYKDKKIMFFVGDSSPAGYGIKDTKDRYPDIIRERLKGGWEVFVIAMPGWDTAEELGFLKKYKVVPDIVVLSYYVNDILKHAVDNRTLLSRNIRIPKNKYFRYLLGRSYLVDYVFHRTWIFNLFQDRLMGVYGQMISSYRDQRTWDAHARDINELIELNKSRDTKLIAVMMPDFAHVGESGEIIEKVKPMFEKKGIRVIDLYEVLKDRKVSDMVVNRHDPHPNMRVHREIAKLLLPVILEY